MNWARISASNGKCTVGAAAAAAAAPGSSAGRATVASMYTIVPDMIRCGRWWLPTGRGEPAGGPVGQRDPRREPHRGHAEDQAPGDGPERAARLRRQASSSARGASRPAMATPISTCTRSTSRSVGRRRVRARTRRAAQYSAVSSISAAKLSASQAGPAIRAPSSRSCRAPSVAGWCRCVATGRRTASLRAMACLDAPARRGAWLKDSGGLAAWGGRCAGVAATARGGAESSG